MINHLIEALGLEFVLADYFRLVRFDIGINFLGQHRHALEQFVSFVETIEIFANRFLARQIEHRSMDIFSEIGRIAFLHRQLRMLRRGFDVK